MISHLGVSTFCDPSSLFSKFIFIIKDSDHQASEKNDDLQPVHPSDSSREARCKALSVIRNRKGR